MEGHSPAQAPRLLGCSLFLLLGPLALDLGGLPWPYASKQNSLAVYNFPPKQPRSASAFEVPTHPCCAPYLPPLLLVL